MKEIAFYDEVEPFSSNITGHLQRADYSVSYHKNFNKKDILALHKNPVDLIISGICLDGIIRGFNTFRKSEKGLHFLQEATEKGAN